MKEVRNILTLLVIVLSSTVHGQSWTGQAYNFFKANDLESAQVAIDSAIKTVERHDPQTWQLRGLIYRDVEKGDSLYNRQIAIESFIHAREIDTTHVYEAQITNYLKNTIIRYYNNAVGLLQEDHNFDKALEFYELYKERHKSLVDPTANFDERDIQFYIALGIQYQNKADIVPQKQKNEWRYKAIDAFDKALEIDSMNFQANFNAGAAYYTIAVDYITGAESEIDIDALVLSTKKAEEAFLKALPYLKRAEIIDPEHIDTKVAFMGCYYGLNNDKLYLKYQTILDEINLPTYLELYEQEPENVENIKEIIRIYRHTIPDEEKAKKFEDILYKVLEEMNNK
jgi:hypothetical protein